LTDAAARPLSDRLTTGLLLGILVMASLNLRVRLSTFTPRYDPNDETGYFRTESAYQYRYARMIADGKAMPEVDYDAQYPEGVRPTKELTPLMEYATGWAYRILAAVAEPPDFRWFVILWVAAVSSLTIPAFYFIARRLCGSTALALAATAGYGLCWAGQSNMVATYVFESFASPLMFGALAFLCAALDASTQPQRRTTAAILAGVLMAAALGSWHLTRFYWASIMLSLAWVAWLKRDDAQAQGRLREALSLMLAVIVPAGLALGCLRENGFLISSPMIFGYGLLAWLWWPQRRPAVIALTAAGLALAAWKSRDASAYAHVYSYMVDKLRYGLVRPADPSKLSDEARAIWNGPADSPSPGFLVWCLFPLGLMTVPRAISLFKKEEAQESLGGSLIDVLLPIYAAGTAMALRLMPFLVFFLALASLRVPLKAARRPAFILGMVVLAALEGFKTFAPASRYNPFIRLAAALPQDDDRHPATTFGNEVAVLRWLKTNAGKNKPTLADISLSANYLVYAGTPILLHPKYEARGLRAKVAEYLKALYSNEETFYGFCKKYGAKLYVLTVYDVLDETPDGTRYTSGSMSLRPGTAAVLFQFKPEGLKHFRLVYQNPDFRIFAVGESPDPRQPAVKLPIFDMTQYDPRVNPDGTLKLDVQGALGRMKDSRQSLFMARIFLRLRRPEQALEAYEAAFAAWPPEAKDRADYERVRASLLQHR
jgi:hypothetical protein